MLLVRHSCRVASSTRAHTRHARVQTDFPVVYCSAINRVAGLEMDEIGEDMSAIFKRIMELPKPVANVDGPLQLQISNIGMDSFIGRLGIGRIKSGSIKKNTPVALSAGPGEPLKQVTISPALWPPRSLHLPQSRRARRSP